MRGPATIGGWRRDLRLLWEYGSYHTAGLDPLAAIAVPAGVVATIVSGRVSGVVVAAIAAAYLVLRLVGVRRLADLDFERGGTLLRVQAHVLYGDAPTRVGLHEGQSIVVDIGGEAVDAICRSGTVNVRRSGDAILERVDGSTWPPLERGDHLEFVSVSGTVGGVAVTEVMRAPGRALDAARRAGRTWSAGVRAMGAGETWPFGPN